MQVHGTWDRHLLAVKQLADVIRDIDSIADVFGANIDDLRHFNSALQGAHLHRQRFNLDGLVKDEGLKRSELVVRKSHIRYRSE